MCLSQASAARIVPTSQEVICEELLSIFEDLQEDLKQAHHDDVESEEADKENDDY